MQNKDMTETHTNSLKPLVTYIAVQTKWWDLNQGKKITTNIPTTTE